MAIVFFCTECDQKLRIDDDFAGRPVACPRCGARLRVPESSRPETPGTQPSRPQPSPEEASRTEAPASGPPAGKTGRRVEALTPLVRHAKRLDFEEMIDMTAMVDIVFFLLIFFLVTSMHVLDSTIPMPVPDQKKEGAREQRSVADIDADNSYIVVRIDRNDTISVEGTEVRSDRDLMFKLRDLRASASRPDKMLVVGHGDASHGTVVMVLDTGRDLGMDQVRLAVQDESE